MIEHRPIPDYANYLAGSDGHLYRKIKHRRHPSYPLKKLTNSVNAYGYRMLSLRRRSKAVHILVALAFLGPKPHSSSQVRHLNGNRLDNRPQNLAWGSHADNEADKIRHGTTNTGTRNGRAVLNVETVRELRAMRELGATYQVLADHFGVSLTNARLVAQRKTWLSV